MTESELDDKLSLFLSKISDWSSGNHITYQSENTFSKNDEVDSILHADKDELGNSTYQQCQEHLFILNQYYSYLGFIISREKSARNWSEQGINYLLAGREFSQYTKLEEKKLIIVRESIIGTKLQELKTISESRIMYLEVKMKSVETVMKIIENIARNKMYERS